jgi:hypothetical protein
MGKEKERGKNSKETKSQLRFFPKRKKEKAQIDRERCFFYGIIAPLVSVVCYNYFLLSMV